MKHHPILISSLLLVIIILLSVVIVQYQSLTTLRLPYTIGAIVQSSSMENSMGMMLKTYPVINQAQAPTIEFTIAKDTMDGWNVYATTTNFSFTPEKLNQAAALGEGHIHIYIDNHLIIMLGNWYHIDSLSPGVHTIRVGLFNNDHSAYSVNGKNIEAMKTVVVK